MTASEARRRLLMMQDEPLFKYALYGYLEINQSSEPKIVTVGSSNARFSATGNGRYATHYKAIPIDTVWQVPLSAIILPSGTTKIRVSRKESERVSFYSSTSQRIIWTKDETYDTPGYTTAIKPISQVDFTLRTSGATSFDFPVPEGADSAFVMIRPASSSMIETLDGFKNFLKTTELSIEFIKD